MLLASYHPVQMWLAPSGSEFIESCKQKANHSKTAWMIRFLQFLFMLPAIIVSEAALIKLDFVDPAGSRHSYHTSPFFLSDILLAALPTLVASVAIQDLLY